MANLSMVSIVESPSNLPLPAADGPLLPTDSPVKLRGRKKLLASFHRMSSSSSLTRLARYPPSSAYRPGGAGSVSCVSLRSAGSPYGHSFTQFSPQASTGFLTAPTSALNTPGLDTPFYDFKAHVRFVGPDSRHPATSSVPNLLEGRIRSRSGTTSSIPTIEEDYFSRPVRAARVKRRENFNFWGDMPSELRTQILRFLGPKDVVRCSAVSKAWYRMCFDGQLWASLDMTAYYRKIPADALVKIITLAGPFVRDLNLRGCVQLREQWSAKGFSDACRNLENFSLEGCRIDRSAIHCFLLQNTRLVHINLSGLAGATNSAMKIIGQYCPRLECLNVSWCSNIDTRGLKKVVEGCPELRDLRAGEIKGWDDKEFCNELFRRNTLERLILMNCDTLTDESLAVIVEGIDNELDLLTGRPIVPPRKLRHLDLTRCRSITDRGLSTLVHNVPALEGLQLSKCYSITDAALSSLLPTIPRLTHLDLEELEDVTNAVLQDLAKCPCKATLEHLSISYCEALGDTGMLPVLKACTRLKSLEMDNTRVSDLVLAEAAAAVRARPMPATKRPHVGLHLVVYDCQNVTWTGVREVLSRNAEIRRLPSTAASASASSGKGSTATGTATTTTTTTTTATPPYEPPAPVQAKEIIALKCFYGWQPTVAEHTKRVLRGDFAAATRLERKWAEFMMASEEAGAAAGAGAAGMMGRRRRRRVREARMMHADEEGEGGVGDGVGGGGGGRGGEEGLGGNGNGGGGGGGGGSGNGGVGRRRRRARSGGCVVM